MLRARGKLGSYTKLSNLNLKHPQARIKITLAVTKPTRMLIYVRRSRIECLGTGSKLGINKNSNKKLRVRIRAETKITQDKCRQSAARNLSLKKTKLILPLLDKKILHINRQCLLKMANNHTILQTWLLIILV